TTPQSWRHSGAISSSSRTTSKQPETSHSTWVCGTNTTPYLLDCLEQPIQADWQQEYPGRSNPTKTIGHRGSALHTVRARRLVFCVESWVKDSPPSGAASGWAMTFSSTTS